VPQVSRLPAALDAPLARLAEAREDLTKAWLMRVIERTDLEALSQLPTERIARDLPPLIAEIIRAVAESPAGGAEPPTSGALRERSLRLAELRGGNGEASAELARDIATLEAVMIGALGRELRSADPHVFVDAIERLAVVFGSVQAAAVEEIVRTRARDLELLANTDDLTGLYNLRYLHQHMDLLLGMQKRYGHPFSLLLLDVDGLKRINDSYGHAAGDRALVGVAAALRDTVRSVDVPARIGGDEFCVLTPHHTASRARIVGDRVGAAVERVETPEGAQIGASIGVVSCPQHGVEANRLLELADTAMYRAKAAGERVVVWSPDDAERGRAEARA
jgi:diguanylate cyclase (GGDEF)-like protein